MSRIRNQAAALALLVLIFRGWQAGESLVLAQQAPPASSASTSSPAANSDKTDGKPTTTPDKPPEKAPEKPARSSPNDLPLPYNRYQAVVSASQTRSTVYDSPRATSVVERDDLKNRMGRTTPDNLNDEPGVFIESSNHGSGSPYVRGLTGQQVLLLIDGIRLNNTTTRTGPNGMLNLIDPYTVDSMEVVRGPGSTLYGSDAVGGVVQVRTRRPTPIAGSDVDLNAGARGIFTSYDLGGQGSLSAGGRWGRYAIDTAFSLRNFGDLTGGSTAPYQPMTAYRDGGLYLGAGVDLGKGTLVLVYQGVRQYDLVLSDRSQPGDLQLQTEASRDLGYLRYDGTASARGLADPVAVQATLSFQRQAAEIDHFVVANDHVDHGDDADNVLGANVHATADLGRPGKLTGGADGYFDFVSSASSFARISAGPSSVPTANPALAQYPDGTTAQSLALYLQDEIDLGRLAERGDVTNSRHPGRLKALIGLRGGVSLLQIPTDNRLELLFPQLGVGAIRASRQEENPVYAGTLHLRYEVLPSLALSAGLMTGYRAPNLADYARLGAEGLGFMVPAGALHPEFATSVEGGVRAALRRLEGGVFYAYTRIDNVIAAMPTTVAGQGCEKSNAVGCLVPYETRENAQEAELHAVEGNARVHLGNGLSIYGVVSYTHGVLETAATETKPATTAPFYKIPPLNGLAAVQLRRPRSLINFAEASVRWAAAQTLLGQADLNDPRVCLPAPAYHIPCPGTPGFAVINLRAAARLVRNVQVTATVENLTNTTYRYHGSGVDGPGLGALLALDANY